MTREIKEIKVMIAKREEWKRERHILVVRMEKLACKNEKQISIIRDMYIGKDLTFV